MLFFAVRLIILTVIVNLLVYGALELLLFGNLGLWNGYPRRGTLTVATVIIFTHKTFTSDIKSGNLKQVLSDWIVIKNM